MGRKKTVSPRKKHFESLFAQIEKNASVIDVGYDKAIHHYGNMKKNFSTLLNREGLETNEEGIKAFKNSINTQFSRENMAQLNEDNIKEVMSNLFFEESIIGPEGNKQTLLEFIMNLFLNNTKLQNVKNQLEKVKNKKIKLSKKNEAKIKELLKQAMEELQNNDEIIASIKHELSTIAGFSETSIDTGDLINNIILPYFRRHLSLQLSGNTKQQASLFYAVAAGFTFEACVADALIKMFNNGQLYKITHSGRANRQDDITITGSNIDKELEKDLFSSISVLTGQGEIDSPEIELNKFLEKQAIASIYGIQIKNAALLKNLETPSKNLDGFDRISNQNDLLQHFRRQVLFNNGRKVENEQDLNIWEYDQRVLQAIQYLSQQTNIIQVMGYINVAYIDKQGLIWTDDLLTLIKEKKHYLSFKAAIGKAKNTKNRNFEAPVGTRNYRLD